MLEQTFCMVKPDGVLRNLVEDIKKRILQAGLKIVDRRGAAISIDEARKLYKVHEGKPFYSGLVKLITSGKVFLMKIEGENAILALRQIMGDTDPRKAEPGTIRGDFKDQNIFTVDGIIKNIIHGSDSKENAEYELGIFFDN